MFYRIALKEGAATLVNMSYVRDITLRGTQITFNYINQTNGSLFSNNSTLGDNIYTYDSKKHATEEFEAIQQFLNKASNNQSPLK